MDNNCTTFKDIAKSKITISIALAVCILVSIFVLPNLFGGDPTETHGIFAEHLEKQQIRALGAFASAKALNAVISILQSIDIEFVVIGFSPFEFLDPANDLIETVSNGLMMALGAVTLQRILLSMNAFLVFKALLPISLLSFIASLWVSNDFGQKMKEISVKAAAVCLALGLFIPASIQLSIFLEGSILGKTIASSQAGLEKNKQAVEVIGSELAQLQQSQSQEGDTDIEEKKEGLVEEAPAPEPQSSLESDQGGITESAGQATEQKSWFSGSLFSSAEEEEPKSAQPDNAVEESEKEGWWSKTKKGISSATSSFSVVNIKSKMNKFASELKDKTDTMVRDFMNLLVIFAINTVILPLFNLWVLWQLVRWILNKPFNPKLPLIPAKRNGKRDSTLAEGRA